MAKRWRCPNCGDLLEPFYRDDLKLMVWREVDEPARS